MFQCLCKSTSVSWFLLKYFLVGEISFNQNHFSVKVFTLSLSGNSLSVTGKKTILLLFFSPHFKRMETNALSFWLRYCFAYYYKGKTDEPDAWLHTFHRKSWVFMIVNLEHVGNTVLQAEVVIIVKKSQQNNACKVFKMISFYLKCQCLRENKTEI